MLQTLIPIDQKRDAVSDCCSAVGDGAGTGLLLVCSARVLNRRVTVELIVTKCYERRDP